MIPRWIQITLRRYILMWKKYKYRDVWPIYEAAKEPPQGWNGWPDNKQFALILTHDVESKSGHDKCKGLMEIEVNLGFISSFNFVPEKYEVDPKLRKLLTANGFEVGVHGLHHDGKLFSSKKMFEYRAQKINHYLDEWSAVGFRAPAMHHNLAWIHKLNIEYDASTFDTDPFEPQSDGVETIFPFYVKNNRDQGYIELPYTLPQDFTLYILMNENNFDIWKTKLDWIAEHGGMALLNTHPDYMRFNNGKLQLEEYYVSIYEKFLTYILTEYKDKYWNVVPRTISSYIYNNYINS